MALGRWCHRTLTLIFPRIFKVAGPEVASWGRLLMACPLWSSPFSPFCLLPWQFGGSWHSLQPAFSSRVFAGAKWMIVLFAPLPFCLGAALFTSSDFHSLGHPLLFLLRRHLCWGRLCCTLLLVLPPLLDRVRSCLLELQWFIWMYVLPSPWWPFPLLGWTCSPLTHCRCCCRGCTVGSWVFQPDIC